MELEEVGTRHQGSNTFITSEASWVPDFRHTTSRFRQVKTMDRDLCDCIEETFKTSWVPDLKNIKEGFRKGDAIIKDWT